jgi:hypothetical protein
MIRYSTEPNSSVVELAVEGHITDAELKASIDRMRLDLEQNGKTRVLEIIARFTGMEPAALWTQLTQAWPLAQKIERAAVVADQPWIRAMTSLGPLFTHAQVKAFAPDEIDQARAWIAAP